METKKLTESSKEIFESLKIPKSDLKIKTLFEFATSLCKKIYCKHSWEKGNK